MGLTGVEAGRKSVETNRWNLVIVIIVNFMATAIALVLLAISVQENPWSLVALGTCVFLLSLYAIEREYKLKKLTEKLVTEELSTREMEAKQSVLISEIKDLSSIQKEMVEGAEMDLNEVSRKILNVLISLFKADRASVMLMDEASQRLMIAAAEGVPQDIMEKTSVKVGEGVAGYVAKVGDPIIISGQADVQDYVNFESKTVNIHSAISAPLLFQNRIIGVINLSLIKKSGRTFSVNELHLLQVFAQYAAVILEQARHSLRTQYVA